MAANRVMAQAFLLLMAALLRFSYAAVYKVGGSAGWTTIGNIDYKQWAATKTFKLGDIIGEFLLLSLVCVRFPIAVLVFEYNAQFHNVMRVTHPMYKACNTSAPLATFTTGNDSISITTKGHHFFFCGVPGHCQSGQKVDINVLRMSETAPASAPSEPTTAATSVPSASVPSPSASTAISPKGSRGSFGKLCFAMAGLVILVSSGLH
ncbi:Major facilitator superfamily protein [Hibiscus syriacus]|uniref:Major facilitator superfamily protein n=1 Tax=Hibiscus syriacus TaxID=106335 RepID=A0A6A2YFP9_HIBSY|nr:Major facilitator superfamily protein [Hibiscus syriacus]